MQCSFLLELLSVVVVGQCIVVAKHIKVQAVLLINNLLALKVNILFCKYVPMAVSILQCAPICTCHSELDIRDVVQQHKLIELDL